VKAYCQPGGSEAESSPASADRRSANDQGNSVRNARSVYGISWFITQQAKYRNFANVYAAIVIIGCIGLGCDMFLAWFGKKIFPWESGHRGWFFYVMSQLFTGPRDQVIQFTLPKEEV
jgi:hypothetical protein